MQLRKNPPFEINPDDPFQDDKLEQKSSIELLTQLIQSTEQPFVITVEAPWGWGKTKFIERWKAYLKKQRHVCLYFNAWENDFVSDPLVAFVGELTPVVQSAEGGNDSKSPVRRGFSRLQKLGVVLAKKSAPILIKAAAAKTLGSDAVKEVAEIIADSAEDVAEVLSEVVQKQIENYEEEKKGIQQFRETLKELAEKVTAGENRPKQLVFFVDELDRCRPDFAMTLLERIKHLFNVQKIVFVLAVDPDQLKNTIRYLYGSGDHAEAYLRRFIDFSFRLPKPSIEVFGNLLQERFQMKEFFQERQNGDVEYERLLPAFVKTASWLNFDLRTQEQYFTRLNAVFHMMPKTLHIPTEAFCVLVGLRIGKPEVFTELIAGDASPSQQVPKLQPDGKNKEFVTFVEQILTVVFLSEKLAKAEATAAQLRIQNERDYSMYDALRRRAWLLEYLFNHRQDFIHFIEFSGRFVN